MRKDGSSHAKRQPAPVCTAQPFRYQPPMLTGRAQIKTPAAARICRRLLTHWSHRFTVTLTTTGGVVDFGDSSCELHSDEAHLFVTVHAAGEATLSEIESIVAEHLQRMAAKEVLSVQWGTLNSAPAYLRGTMGHLAYETAGQGECIVLCHAMSADRSLWRHQMQSLNRQHSTLIFDIRGHGQSSVPVDGDYSFDALAADVISLMDHCGIARASIAGISLGGEVAQCVAAKYPNRVRRLFLSSTACFTTEARAALWGARIAEAQALGMESIAAAAAHRWFSDEFRLRDPATVDACRRQIAANSVQTYVGVARTIQSMDLRPMIRGISCPTHIVCGDQDGNTGPAIAAGIAACIPAATMQVIAAAGHFPNLENPTEFNESLLRWLSASA